MSSSFELDTTPSKRPRMQQSLSTPSLQDRVNDLLSQSSTPDLIVQQMQDLQASIQLLKDDQISMQAQSTRMMEENKKLMTDHSQQLVVDMQSLMNDCRKQFDSQQQALRDLSQSSNYMGQDLRRLHQHQQKNSAEVGANVRLTETISSNVQQLIRDQHQQSSIVHDTRSRQDLLDSATRQHDHITSSAVKSLQDQLLEAKRLYESLQLQLNSASSTSTSAEVPASSYVTGSTPIRQPSFAQADPQGRENVFHDNPRRNSTSVHGPVRRPPKFDADRYGRYKEEIALWADAHSHADPHVLISEMALSAGDTFRIVMMNYIANTKSDPRSRSFDSLFAHLDKEYLRDASERSTQKLQQFQNFVRKPHETINSFWIRFSKLAAEAEANGLTMSSSMLFLRALQAMALSPDQKNTVLAALHGSSDSQSHVELRNITLRLFNTPLKSTDVYQLDEHEDTFIAKGKGNRPGQEKNAVQTASRTFNFPNGNGKKFIVFKIHWEKWIQRHWETINLS